MAESELLFVFCLEMVRHAISLSMVERVIRAVEVTPFSGASGIVSGVINYHGNIMPVINTRRLFGFAEREITPDDLFIIVRTGRRQVALVADSIEHVAGIPADRIAPMDDIAPGGRFLTGIVRMESGLIMIHDLENCIRAAELPPMEHSPEKVVTHVEAG